MKLKRNIKLAASVIAVSALLLHKPIIHFATTSNLSGVEVTRTERISDGESGKYLVWTSSPKGAETFQNTDSWLALKFNSSDVQGEFSPGSKCKMRVNGLRIPIFSMYRNILSADCSTSVTS